MEIHILFIQIFTLKIAICISRIFVMISLQLFLAV